MARFYTYINPAEIEAQFDEDEKKKGIGKENPYSSLEPVSQTNMWRAEGKWRKIQVQHEPWPLSKGQDTPPQSPDGEDLRSVSQNNNKAVF